MKTVIFCIPGRLFSDNFVSSWSNLLTSCNNYGVKPLLRMAHSNNIYIVRNLCLMGNKQGKYDQKPFQGQVRYDYVMWIDSDSVFTAKHFEILFNEVEKKNKISILAGLYLAEDRKRYLAHYLPDDKYSKKFNSEFVEQTQIKHLPEKPFEVLFSGMGFMIVRYGVLESLNYPWFEPEVIKHKSGERIILGDDAAFCVKAKKSGFATYVYPKVIIGHEKPVVLI